jgi:histidinol phosphatase-like PHP family hydrolase
MVKLTWNYHCHTSYTDGFHTIDEIAQYCAENGIEELAVTEHVRNELRYDFDRLLFDIRNAEKKFRVHIISGVEAKILDDGKLDCPDEIRSKADIVIGSVHGLGGMTVQDAYERLSRSDCMIIGHPQFCNEKVIKALRETGKIVELSSRYEQSGEMIKTFRDAGLLFSIGLDSHRLSELNDFGTLPELIERLGLQERLWRFKA